MLGVEGPPLYINIRSLCARGRRAPFVRENSGEMLVESLCLRGLLGPLPAAAHGAQPGPTPGNDICVSFQKLMHGRTLLTEVENHRTNLMVVLAGYKAYRASSFVKFNARVWPASHAMHRGEDGTTHAC